MIDKVDDQKSKLAKKIFWLSYLQDIEYGPWF